MEESGTTIIKFYLHVSKEKQKEKLNDRLLDPTKYWKHNIGDWDTRNDFDEYIEVYENIFDQCNKPERHVIASDKNRYKVYQVSKILLKALEAMNLKWPQLSPDQETSYLKAKAELIQRDDTGKINKKNKYRLKLEKKKVDALNLKKAKLEKKKLAKLLQKQQKIDKKEAKAIKE